MAEVFVDISKIEKVVIECKRSIEEMSTLSNSLRHKKQTILREWKDEKSKEFDNIVASCVQTLDKSKKELQRTLGNLNKLYSITQEYESISFEKKRNIVSETRARLDNFAQNIERHVDDYNNMGEAYFLTEEGRAVSHGISKVIFNAFCEIIGVKSPFLGNAGEIFASLCDMALPNVLNSIQTTANNLHSQYNDPYTLINRLFPYENEGGVRISSVEWNNFHKLNSNFDSDGLNVQMVDITGLKFSLSEVNKNSENEVKEIYEMLNEYVNGLSINDCWSRFPTASNYVFGNQQIEAHSYGDNCLTIDTNRQIVATAQSMGAHFLPIVVR